MKPEDENEDEVWNTMEMVTEKSKKRPAQTEKAAVTVVDEKKKRKVAKK